MSGVGLFPDFFHHQLENTWMNPNEASAYALKQIPALNAYIDNSMLGFEKTKKRWKFMFTLIFFLGGVRFSDLKQHVWLILGVGIKIAPSLQRAN